MILHLVRHGETAASDRLIGRTDVALSDAGRGQLDRQALRLDFDALVTSPLQRTRLPAEQLAAARGTPLRVDADWAELDFGDWDGRLHAELRGDAVTGAALAAIYLSPDAAGAPGGESWRQLEARTARALRRLLDERPDGRALVSTHGGPIRAALALICAIPFANLWAFRIDPGTRVTLRAERDAAGNLWGEIIEVAQP